MAWRGDNFLNRTSEISSRDYTRMDATWTHHSRDLHLTVVIHRDRGLIGRSASSIYLRSIGRCRRIEEEPHDRGAIEPRSRRNRAAILQLSSRIHFNQIRRHFLEHLEYDRRPIVARSRRDRGRSWRKSWPSWRLI